MGMDKRLKRSLKVGIPIGLLMASGLGWMFWTSAAYERELDLARRAGLLRTAQELLSKPVPLDQNAAPLYADAYRQARLLWKGTSLVAAYRPEMDSKEQIRIFGRAYTPAEAAEQIDRELVHWKPVFDLVEEASSRPQYAVYVNWDDPNDPWRHELNFHPFRGLSVDALRQAAKGSFGTAKKRCDQLDQMAMHLGTSHHAGYLANAFQSAADSLCLELAARYPELHEYAKRRFGRVREGLDIRRTLRFQLKGNLAALETYYRNPKRLGFRDEDLRIEDPLRYRSLNESLATVLTQATRRAYARLPKNSKDWRKNRDALASIDAAVRSNLVGQVSHLGFVGNHEYLADFYPRSLQRQRLCLAALVLLEEQRRTGKIPDQLPKDAATHLEVFTDKPFHYEKTTEGWRLYGADENGLDENDRLRGIHWIEAEKRIDIARW